jgi:hypothetical protein
MAFYPRGFSFVFSLWLEVEAKKLYNNIVTDLGVSILESVKVESLEDFINQWKLKLWELCFFKNSSLRVESWKVKLGNNKLVVKKLSNM